MLTAYLARTNLLLQNPAPATALYSTTDLTSYINQARGQLAGESECVRLQATLPTINATQTYAFSTFNTGTSSVNGIQGVLNSRMVVKTISGGKTILNGWPWEWFNQFYIPVQNVSNATPTDWAQYGQGVNGSLYLYPTPDAIYTLTIDCVCYPIDLVNDGTVDAIPFPWTDAVAYFAAYLALLSDQTNARIDTAMKYFEIYGQFVSRARRMATATVLPFQYEQSGYRVPVPPAGIEIKGKQQ